MRRARPVRARAVSRDEDSEGVVVQPTAPTRSVLHQQRIGPERRSGFALSVHNLLDWGAVLRAPGRRDQPRDYDAPIGQAGRIVKNGDSRWTKCRSLKCRVKQLSANVDASAADDDHET
jgi:hypothetical protein